MKMTIDGIYKAKYLKNGYSHRVCARDDAFNKGDYKKLYYSNKLNVYVVEGVYHSNNFYETYNSLVDAKNKYKKTFI